MTSRLKLKVKNSKFQGGFTLIELLIYMGIFVIVTTFAMDFLFQSKTLESQITQDQEIARSARTVFLEMTQTVRGASNVSTPALGASGSALGLNSGAITYVVNSNGILQKTESGQTSDITTAGVKVEDLLFTTRGETGEKPTVSVVFTMKATTRVLGASDFTQKTYQTTIQLR